MQQAVDGLGLQQGEKDTFTDFLRCINLCHDCIALKDPKNPDKLVYNGPSVDEVCLLDMARDAGIGHYVNRDSSTIEINLHGKAETYELIKIFPFTSERKAMSVVLMHPNGGKAICFVKGADSSVFPMCNGYAPNGQSAFDSPSHPNAKLTEVE